MPDCEMSEKNSENILSPNQRWLNKKKISKFKSKNQWMKTKKSKINLKFRLPEIFPNFLENLLSNTKSFGKI